jgi:hypothetical protein
MASRKKLRELKRTYEILNSHESFHITTVVNAGTPSRTKPYVQETAMVMH